MADPVSGRIEALLTGSLNIPQEKIRPEADLRHDLGLDSFAAVELGYAIEEEFAIKVTDEELASVKTLGDLVAAVRRKVQGTTPEAAPAAP
ncbi:MAG TPA: acyl carrier protein [Planctomycetota bacterium]|nr:acyl carrier protein [Planctomycetota bacterium]